MKRSTARVALPQSKLAGTVTDGAGCAVEGDAAPDSAKAAERSKSPGRSADLLVMDDDPWIVAKVLLTDRERIAAAILRSEEHTSALQSLMRISSAGLCL